MSSYDIIYYISIHPFFSETLLGNNCHVAFFERQTGRIGAWVVAIGVVVSVSSLFPSFFCIIFLSTMEDWMEDWIMRTRIIVQNIIKQTIFNIDSVFKQTKHKTGCMEYI
jgi:hypothetical protein